MLIHAPGAGGGYSTTVRCVFSIAPLPQPLAEVIVRHLRRTHVLQRPRR